ncbi:hypothetical protein VMCG_09032 [Cytospora schulzeri]|uniref:NIMA interactive protein n=1 Tax=Cytospora schulzeri TaxID=448051 RepID=A0A423VNZ5_9PEZI|nr:hypothetical protein VMCG_09032 [Valsa malicola]
MIDFDNLRTASLYINNQLLSRGLLRDGRGIDFADPGDTDYDLADTMGRIISVVNDLILRRDVWPPLPSSLPSSYPLVLEKRDAEHRESLSTTLRTLRADSLRQSDNFSRLQEKYTEAQRKISLHEAEDNAVRAQLKAAESAVHKLKEEAARAKRLVAETRATCANEVRKRDRQIDGLKKAAADAGRARGERRAPGITTIQVVGDVGAEEDLIAAGASTADENYDLRQETNGFLAQLAKGLNEENETLLALLRKTGDNLKEMSGWDKTEAATASKRDSHAVSLVTSPEDISTDIDAVLDHLRNMLTNPSFVPLEEVVVREEEIFRLRDGWEKMESRWRDTVHLIDSWHRRIAANGRPVDVEELQMGLRLSPVRIQSIDRIGGKRNAAFGLATLHEEEEVEQEEEEEEEEDDEEIGFAQKPGSPSPAGSLHLVPAPGYEDTPEYEGGPDDIDDSDAESSIFHEDVEGDLDINESEDSEPNVEILQQSTEDPTSMPVPPSRKGAPLEESNGAGNRKPNTRIMEKSRKRSGDLMAGDTDGGDEVPTPPPHGAKQGQSPQKRLKVSADPQDEKPKSSANSGVLTNSDPSLNSVKPSPEISVSQASNKPTTTKATRSDGSVKKEQTPAPRKPATGATRAATARPSEQPKKDAPTITRPPTRQWPTRATAPTSSSTARIAVPKSAESPKPRAQPAPATSADMPPPARPTRSANSSPRNDKTHPAPQTLPQEDSKTADKNPPPPISTTVQAEPTTSSSTTSDSKRSAPAPAPAPTAPESPTRFAGKATSRLPLPRNAGPLPPPQQSPLSMARIAAKLAASEREADAARVKAKLRAARLNKAKGGSGSTANGNGNGPATQLGSTSSAVASSSVPGNSHDGAGDPVKRGRSSVSAAGMTGSGASYSADENGRRGGVPVREDPVASSSGTAERGDVVMTGVRNDNHDDVDDLIVVGDNKQTAVPSPRKKATTTTTISSSSPRKASPTKASPTKATSSPAKERPRKREVRSRADRVANRRRSTLNPWELQSLISGEVVPPSPRRVAQVAAGEQE